MGQDERGGMLQDGGLAGVRTSFVLRKVEEGWPKRSIDLEISISRLTFPSSLIELPHVPSCCSSAVSYRW